MLRKEFKTSYRKMAERVSYSKGRNATKLTLEIGRRSRSPRSRSHKLKNDSKRASCNGIQGLKILGKLQKTSRC